MSSSEVKSIYWRDAVYIQNTNLEDVKDKKLPLVVTYGVIEYKDIEKLIVCTHKTVGSEEDIFTEGNDYMVIPVAWIDRIE